VGEKAREDLLVEGRVERSPAAISKAMARGVRLA